MKEFFEKVRKYVRASDTSLLLAVLACSAISCIMLYSIASNELESRCDMSTFRTQVVASCLGLVMVIVLSVIDYNRYIRLWFIYAPFAVLMTLLTFTPLGYSRSGADDRA